MLFDLRYQILDSIRRCKILPKTCDYMWKKSNLIVKKKKVWIYLTAAQQNMSKAFDWSCSLVAFFMISY